MKDDETQWHWRKFQINVTREFTANLILWRQILDFEFHLSHCLPLTLYTVMIFFTVNFRSLYIFAFCLYPISLISHSPKPRDYEFFSTSHPLAIPSCPTFFSFEGNFTSPSGSITAIFFGLSRGISKIFPREKWRFWSRNEILGLRFFAFV